MKRRDFDPIHPGEILLEEFLKPMGITLDQLAKDMSVPLQNLSEIIQGKRAINADMALRLGYFFGMEAQFWMNLQTRYDLICSQTILATRLEQEVHPYLPKSSLQTVPLCA
ncbi:MAG: HigA family addiction module antitoxin [Pseudomonadota bacterium]